MKDSAPRRGWVNLDPTRKRQLEGDGGIVLWRERGGVRTALAAAVAGCSNPECKCPTVSLSGIFVDENAARMKVTSETIRFEHRPGTLAGKEHSRFDVSIDVRTGAVKAIRPETSSEEMAWLRAEMDGELLDYLNRQRWLHKGLDPDKPDPAEALRQREPSEMLGYAQVYHAARLDLYLLEGETYACLDFYCANRDCDCGDALLAFARMDAEEISEPVGKVRLALGGERAPSRPESVELQPRAASDRATLESLYGLFRQRYPTDRSLLARRALLTQYASKPARLARLETLESWTTHSSVGRNDPCPCGSGKKFKHCCMSR